MASETVHAGRNSTYVGGEPADVFYPSIRASAAGKVLMAFLLYVVLGFLCTVPASAQAPPRAGTNTAILRGTITMGPTIPVQRVGGPPAIAPVAGARVDIAKVNGATVASVTTGTDGCYSVPLAPGDYLVTVKPATRMFPRIASQSVTVAPGASTALDITLDTGIR